VLRRRAAILLATILTGSACAGRRVPTFAPAGAGEAERALAAWRQSVERAQIRPAKLLYDARVSQGPFRMSGTLAVRAGAQSVEATLAGPFGDTLANYAGGVFTGKNIRPLRIDEQELRWFLAGAWRGAGQPEIGGTSGGKALLRWSGPEEVEAILDIPSARVSSLEVRRREGAIRATYPEGSAQPEGPTGRPRRIDLEDLKSGNVMKLTLVAEEPIHD